MNLYQDSNDWLGSEIGQLSNLLQDALQSPSDLVRGLDTTLDLDSLAKEPPESQDLELAI